jgi:hypothetical protein
MSNQDEKWWERVPRILGGWGFAVLVFFRFPKFAFMEEPGATAWMVYVGLMVFFVGIAHSTVMGIVLGQLGRAYSFVRRGGKDRRDSTDSTRVQEAVDIPMKDRRKR